MQVNSVSLSKISVKFHSAKRAPTPDEVMAYLKKADPKTAYRKNEVVKAIPQTYGHAVHVKEEEKEEETSEQTFDVEKLLRTRKAWAIRIESIAPATAESLFAALDEIDDSAFVLEVLSIGTDVARQIVADLHAD